MTGAPGIDSLFGDLDRLIDTASAATDALRPSREKDLLSAAITRLKALRAGADTGIKESLDLLRGQCQAHLDRLADMQARITATRAELDQAVAAVSAPPVAPTVPVVPAFTVDTALGGRLRDDLLRRFGPPADDGPPPARPGKDVWENWT